MNRKPITLNKIRKLADKMSQAMSEFFDIDSIDVSVGYAKNKDTFCFWRQTGHRVHVIKMKNGGYIVTSQTEEPDPEYMWMGVDDD
jgi:hypothetical protein